MLKVGFKSAFEMVSRTCYVSGFHFIFCFAYTLGYVCHLSTTNFVCWTINPVQSKGKSLRKNKSKKKWKESEKPRNEIAKSCNLIFPYLFWTDSHSDCFHRYARTSPLLGYRKVFLQPQPPVVLYCLLHTPLSSHLYKHLSFLCTVLGRLQCHILHLSRFVQQ